MTPVGLLLEETPSNVGNHCRRHAKVGRSRRISVGETRASSSRGSALSTAAVSAGDAAQVHLVKMADSNRQRV